MALQTSASPTNCPWTKFEKKIIVLVLVIYVERDVKQQINLNLYNPYGLM